MIISEQQKKTILNKLQELITVDQAKEINRRERLDTALQASSLQHTRSGMEQERRRLEVEDRAAQKSMGQEPIEGGDDDMGDVFMADNITFPSEAKPVPPNPLKTLLGMSALALALGVPAAWAYSQYLETQRPLPETPEFVDTDRVRTLRISRD